MSPNARSVVAAPAIEDNGVRRSCESEFEQRVAHLLVFLHRRRVYRVARKQRAIKCDCGQINDRRQRALILRRDRLLRGMRLEAAYRDRPARSDERPELIGDAWKRTRSPARRLLFLLRPTRGAKSGGVELRVGRPGGANLQVVPFRDKENDAAAECRVQMRRRRPQHVVRPRSARKLARVIVERLRNLSVPDHGLPLVANAPGQGSGEHRDGKKDEQGEQFLRLRHRERVDRLDEEEIVGGERSERGDDRGAGAEAHGAEQHRGEENHRQIGKFQNRGERLADRDGAGDGNERARELDAQPLAAEKRPEAWPKRCPSLLAGNDVDLDPAGVPHQRLWQRPAENAAQQSRPRLAKHDLGHVFAPCEPEDFGRVVAALEPHRVPAQTLGETEQFGELIGAVGVGGLADRLDRHRGPRRIKPGRELTRTPDHPLRDIVGAHAGEEALRGGPGAFDGSLAEIVDHLIVDTIGGAPQRQLAQRGQIAGREETLGRPPGRLRHIHFAFVQALNELVRREIDENDVGGLLQDPIGNGLAHDNASDARDNVGEAFEMLNIERGPDVDTGSEQLLDVLPALGVPAIGSVGVSELIDDDQLGLARQRRIEIEFLDFAAVVFNPAPRQDFEPVNESARLGAAMGLDKADDHIDAFVPETPRILQHRVGLADAGRGAEEHFQPARGLPAERGQKRVRIGASIVGSARWGHWRSWVVMTTLTHPALNSAAKR